MFLVSTTGITTATKWTTTTPTPMTTTTTTIIFLGCDSIEINLVENVLGQIFLVWNFQLTNIFGQIFLGSKYFLAQKLSLTKMFLDLLPSSAKAPAQTQSRKSLALFFLSPAAPPTHLWKFLYQLQLIFTWNLSIIGIVNIR